MTFAFISVLQNALAQTEEYWNKHHIGITTIFVKIRQGNSNVCPSLLYSISAVSDMHDYGLDMPGNVIDEMYVYGTLF